MKKAMLLIFVVLGTTVLSAQRGNGGWGQNSNYGRMFNPSTIETLTGSIVAVERIVPEAKMSYGLHLKVQTEKGVVSVHLGPTWYLDNQEIQFKEGDKVVVEGSRITFNSAPAIIAIYVEKDDHVLKLRDPSGYPVWNGWRKKGMGRRMGNG
jgi:hypothetical protein